MTSHQFDRDSCQHSCQPVDIKVEPTSPIYTSPASDTIQNRNDGLSEDFCLSMIIKEEPSSPKLSAMYDVMQNRDDVLSQDFCPPMFIKVEPTSPTLVSGTADAMQSGDDVLSQEFDPLEFTTPTLISTASDAMQSRDILSQDCPQVNIKVEPTTPTLVSATPITMQNKDDALSQDPCLLANIKVEPKPLMLISVASIVMQNRGHVQTPDSCPPVIINDGSTIPPFKNADSVLMQNREQLNYFPVENEKVKKKRAVRFKKSGAQLHREYRARLTPEEKQKARAHATAYMREYRARKKRERAGIYDDPDKIAITDVRTLTSTDPLQVAESQKPTTDENPKIQVPLNDILTISAESNEENQKQLIQRCITSTNADQNSSEHAGADAKLKNNFDAVCSICDRLWYKKDLKSVPPNCTIVFTTQFPHMNIQVARVCNNCYISLKEDKMPTLSRSNDFKILLRSNHLPKLDLRTERLISPLLPFMQISRSRHGQDQCGILGQVINIPVSTNTMVHCQLRNCDDDYCIKLHIKHKKIHKSSYLIGSIKKRVVKGWVRYLVDTPLYRFRRITLNESFFSEYVYKLKAALTNKGCTSAIHFNNPVEIIVSIRKSKPHSPFRNYCINRSFKRIKFQRRGSLHANISLWLDESLVDALGVNKAAAETRIDKLVYASTVNFSSHEKLENNA